MAMQYFRAIGKKKKIVDKFVLPEIKSVPTNKLIKKVYLSMLTL